MRFIGPGSFLVYDLFGSALILLAGALSAFWAFAVPIFQGPDEPAHFDYAISIYPTPFSWYGHALINAGLVCMYLSPLTTARTGRHA